MMKRRFFCLIPLEIVYKKRKWKHTEDLFTLSSCTRKAVFQTIRGNAVKADILYVCTKFCRLRVLFNDPYLSHRPNLSKAGMNAACCWCNSVVTTEMERVESRRSKNKIKRSYLAGYLSTGHNNPCEVHGAACTTRASVAIICGVCFRPPRVS